MTQCILIKTEHGCDTAYPIEEAEAKKLVKAKQAILMEGIIYRETYDSPKKAPPKKKAAKKSTYKTKVATAE